jgi:Ca2+-binding RTX toxin-like protein
VSRLTAPGQERPTSATANVGAAYLIYGKPAGEGVGQATSGQNIVDVGNFGAGDGYVIYGRGLSDFFGNQTLSNAVGDVNQDGVDDVFVSAPVGDLQALSGVTTGRPDLGITYVINGSASLGGLTLTGTAGAETLLGGTYNDSISGGGGADYIASFTGNDVISIPDLSFQKIDAGAGNLDVLRLGDATALHHHRHALSGLCRILGADHLEQAVHASFIDEADFAAFDACLRATITALQARAIISQKGRDA